MSHPRVCPKCGQAVPKEAPAGHCPACLVEFANRLAHEETPWPEKYFDPKDRRFGAYILGRQLGAGGMGVVYEARHADLEQKVAVKLIRDAHLASPTQVCRFTIEAEAAARLDHPNIVRIHEIGECNGHPFFSMDLISGESLSAKIAKGEFSLERNGHAGKGRQHSRQAAIARLMTKTARAVHHAHERGVLHRDLKPGNILVDPAGEPHLTDFGLAKLLQQPLEGLPQRALTTPGEFPGTPSYMSPEQVSGEEVTCASDIYGLGAVLYELLTGWPPFEGATPLETFKQIVEQQPCRPRALNPGVHPDLETICLKCLEKDPRHRYSSAAAMADDLELWIAGGSIRARPAGYLRRTSEWIQRNPIGTALIVTLCVGLSIALTLLKIVNDQRKEIERDRDQTFDEGMQKVSLIWKDADTREVTISGRELAILAGRSPKEVSEAKHQLFFGVTADGEPSSMAQRYARWLSRLQDELTRELGEEAVFELKLFKRFNLDEDSLARGDADLMVLSPVDYLKAEGKAPAVLAIAREKLVRESVIFAHTNAGIYQLRDLARKSLAFPHPDLAMSVWAKAHLATAGLRAGDLGAWTNIVDQGMEAGQIVISVAETVNSVLKRQTDAGVTFRERYERYKHLGLVMLDRFPDTPNVLALRQGLDPRLVQGLRNAIRSLEAKGGFSTASGDLIGEMVLMDASDLAGLRAAFRQAQQFETPAGRPN